MTCGEQVFFNFSPCTAQPSVVHGSSVVHKPNRCIGAIFTSTVQLIAVKQVLCRKCVYMNQLWRLRLAIRHG